MAWYNIIRAIIGIYYVLVALEVDVLFVPFIIKGTFRSLLWKVGNYGYFGGWEDVQKEIS